jgi:hypothetical protein
MTQVLPMDQERAYFSITSAALPPESYVMRLEGQEQLGRPYELSIDILIPTTNELDLDEVIGATASFTPAAEGHAPRLRQARAHALGGRRSERLGERGRRHLDVRRKRHHPAAKDRNVAMRNPAMRDSMRCPNCECRRLWQMHPFMRRLDDQVSVEQVPVLAVAGQFSVQDFKVSQQRAEAGTFELWICVQCGYTEWYARDVNLALAELARAGRGGVKYHDAADGTPYRSEPTSLRPEPTVGEQGQASTAPAPGGLEALGREADRKRRAENEVALATARRELEENSRTRRPIVAHWPGVGSTLWQRLGVYGIWFVFAIGPTAAGLSTISLAFCEDTLCGVVAFLLSSFLCSSAIFGAGFLLCGWWERHRLEREQRDLSTRIAGLERQLAAPTA